MGSGSAQITHPRICHTLGRRVTTDIKSMSIITVPRIFGPSEAPVSVAGTRFIRKATAWEMHLARKIIWKLPSKTEKRAEFYGRRNAASPTNVLGWVQP